MSTFFNNFPIINYDMNKTGQGFQSVDLLKRFKPLDSILSRAALYYEYVIRDGDRPDIVSHKYYDSTDYDWIILLFNLKLDPYFDWPMTSQEMERYLEKVYGSVRNSTQTVHHYERILQAREKLYDGTIIEERVLTVDHTTYLDLEDYERRLVYNYDYEVQQNENRRLIRIPNERYLPQIEAERKRIFG